MNKVIGVISYLPEDNKIRSNRIEKLGNLLKQCDRLFQLPIVIIAQNWKDLELPQLDNSKLIVYKYKDRLGITGARRALRNVFINSEYDYLIMLDDDIVLRGPQEGFDEYLSLIDKNPSGYGLFKALTLQLFAISKDLFSKIDYPQGDPQTGDFFEDMWLIMALNKLYSQNKFLFPRDKIEAVGDAARDPNSTWYHGQVDKHIIGSNTRNMVSKL